MWEAGEEAGGVPLFSKNDELSDTADDFVE
jgi:hypothetical protein